MTRLKQLLIILLGLALAAGMAVLGIWQLDVYKSQGNRSAAERASAPPVDLTKVAPVAAPVQDGFGRSVSFAGRYDRSLQLLVPVDGAPGSYRVLSGFRLTSGAVVPVVRGLVTGQPVGSGAKAPSAPSAAVTQVGVLLPSEDNDAPGTDSTQLTAVRLPALAQRWPGDLVGGFVTLSADEARSQGLTAAPLVLPASGGRFRNGAYALQWWVFGAFAIAMAVRIARDLGYREDLEDLGVDADEELDAGDGAGAEAPDRRPTV